MFNCAAMLPPDISSKYESSLIARDVFGQVHQPENTVNPE
jgi:hypothetical protein